MHVLPDGTALEFIREQPRAGVRVACATHSRQFRMASHCPAVHTSTSAHDLLYVGSLIGHASHVRQAIGKRCPEQRQKFPA